MNKPWLCRIGFHKWGQWWDFEGIEKRWCVDCAKEDWKVTRNG